uniref:ATPase subunits 8 n=1 Tax=Neocalanus cristatus TaxID=119368 RepID=Q6L9V4_NEOCR|nr:ATPase subunits 8 [Neocalanus cristatus]
MPQMSPMNWFFLFLYFNLMLYMNIVKIYYLSNITVSQNTMKMFEASAMPFLI